MKFILGKKVGMSQLFAEDGTAIAVTLIEAGPVTVTQVRSKEKDGYKAVQVGFDPSKKNVNKALKGHFKGLGNFRHVKEFSADGEYKVGDVIAVDAFIEGDNVKVAGISKGKGFQGVVKRHGFAGMPASHGHKPVQRHAGSIGQRFPQRTLKGLRMGGHMGAERVTVRNLKVVKIDKENNLLMVKGAVPGNRGAVLEIIG